MNFDKPLVPTGETPQNSDSEKDLTLMTPEERAEAGYKMNSTEADFTPETQFEKWYAYLRSGDIDRAYEIKCQGILEDTMCQSEDAQFFALDTLQRSLDLVHFSGGGLSEGLLDQRGITKLLSMDILSHEEVYDTFKKVFIRNIRRHNSNESIIDTIGFIPHTEWANKLPNHDVNKKLAFPATSEKLDSLREKLFTILKDPEVLAAIEKEKSN